MKDMMKHLPNNLKASFSKLWASQQSQTQPIMKRVYQKAMPVLSDRITCLMTLK